MHLGRTRVHVGAPVVVPPPELLVKSHFLDQHEKRHLISRALGEQIPDPGSVSRRARHENRGEGVYERRQVLPPKIPPPY